MKRYLLDTGIAGHFVNDRKGVRSRARQERQKGNVIGVCVPGLGELYDGVEYSDSRDRNLQKLVVALKLLKVWPYNPDAAEVYGRLAAHLRRTGRPMQHIDIQLAAIALTLGNCTVVSADSDLSAVPGLSVGTGRRPDYGRTSHRFSTPSSLPVASVFPSGPNAAAWIVRA